MTEITFVGTGEAFDPLRATTSYLINTYAGTLMVDCGYNAPKSLMKFLSLGGKSVADVPDSVLFTHEHGDHFGGLPALLMPIWEEINGVVGKRSDGLKRKIEIASAHEHLLERVEEDMERDYRGFFERFRTQGPDISLRHINQSLDAIQGLKVWAALTSHGAPNYAYKFEDSNGRKFAISGDGALTSECKTMYNDVELLIHEGFNIIGSGGKNHASVEEVVNYAIDTKVKRVFIVHVNRQEREKKEEIKRLQDYAEKKDIELVIADDHQTIEI